MIVSSMLLLGTVVAVSFYLAFEPIVRGRWPWSLIAWNRLLSRGIADPLVGRDVLIGAVLSISGTAIYQLLIAGGVGLIGDRPPTIAFRVFMGARHLAAALVAAVPEALTSSMLLVLLFSVLVKVLRRTWVAGALLTAAFVIPLAVQMRSNRIEVVLLSIAFGLLVTIFVHVGLGARVLCVLRPRVVEISAGRWCRLALRVRGPDADPLGGRSRRRHLHLDDAPRSHLARPGLGGVTGSGGFIFAQDKVAGF